MLTAVRQKGGGTDNNPGGNDAFSAAPLLNVQLMKLRNIVLLTPESRALPQQQLQFLFVKTKNHLIFVSDENNIQM